MSRFKLPIKCKQLPQAHYADICVFTVNFLKGAEAAEKAAKQRDKGKKFGKVNVRAQEMYWCLVGLVDDDSIYHQVKKGVVANG